MLSREIFAEVQQRPPMTAPLNIRRDGESVKDQNGLASYAPSHCTPFGQLPFVKHYDPENLFFVRQYKEVSTGDGFLEESSVGILQIPLQNPLCFEYLPTVGNEFINRIKCVRGCYCDIHLNHPCSAGG